MYIDTYAFAPYSLAIWPWPTRAQLGRVLGFDGTLVGPAPTPEYALMAPALTQLPADLGRPLSGAGCLISGRSQADIGAFLRHLQLCAAGGHGAECDGALMAAAPGRSGTLTPDA